MWKGLAVLGKRTAPCSSSTSTPAARRMGQRVPSARLDRWGRRQAGATSSIDWDMTPPDYTPYAAGGAHMPEEAPGSEERIVTAKCRSLASLLIAPLWRVPHLGSLALATLRPILEGKGIAVDELHGATLFPVAGDDFDVNEAYSRYLFAAALRGREVDAFVDEALEAILRDANMNGVLFPANQVTWANIGADVAPVRARFRRDVMRANECLERIVERTLAGDYDVVGLSLPVRRPGAGRLCPGPPHSRRPGPP